MTRNQTEELGWAGVALILGAYLGNVFGWWSAENVWYLLANVAGSAALIVEAKRVKNWQPVVLNVVWLAVAAVGILRVLW